MNETKPFFASLTFWGVAMTVLALAAKKVFNLDVDQQTQDDTSKYMADAATFLGAGMALVGRWKATKPLSMAGTPKQWGTVLFLSLLVGCTTCPEKALLREAMARPVEPVHEDVRRIFPLLATTNPSDRPAITPQQLKQTIGALDDFDAAVREDRERDTTK